ncbi:MAG TPA: hypothetical protein VK348_02165 [Planctomycetota bacterium]|nr:hypothetical protein [Planctomycetota bacterium]
MKGWIVNLVAGIGLFAASMVGVLAATGRLNHEGTASIPLLGSLFPEPPSAAKDAGETGRSGDGKGGADAHKNDGVAADARGKKVEPAAAQDADGPQGEANKDAEPRKLKRGRSLFDKDDKGGEHGEQGGEGAPKDGAAATKGGEGAPKDHGDAELKPKAGERSAEGDFEHLQTGLVAEHARYTPGAYFHFDGLPAGITPEQLNQAWQRVQQTLGDLDKRRTALDLREQELQALEQDVARRQTELGKERQHLETLQKEFDSHIEQFQQQVKLVRTDEVAALKRNAQTLATFEPAKAAELVQEQWKTERGQDEVLKTLELMDKDAVNTLLAALPNALTREVLQKRLKVVREPEKK